MGAADGFAGDGGRAASSPRRATALLSLVGLALSVAAPAQAVWGGEPDGDRHPFVGAVYGDVDRDGTIDHRDLLGCSVVYAGPSHTGADVLLVAGHCIADAERTGFTPATAFVSFDADRRDGLDEVLPVQEWHRMPGLRQAASGSSGPTAWRWTSSG